MRKLCAAFIVGSAAGCAPLSSAPSLTSADFRTPPAHDVIPNAPLEGVPLHARPGLVVALSAPKEVPWLPSSGGIAGLRVDLAIANVDDRVADIGDMKVSFSAIRDGVPFVCSARSGRTEGDRVARSIAPRERLVLDRIVECGAMVPGEHELAVHVAFGNAPAEHAGSSPFTLVGGGDMAPQEIGGHPGLYAAIVSRTLVRAMPASAWHRGELTPVVMIVNAGANEVAVGGVRAKLEMKDRQGRVRCRAADARADAVIGLAPGAAHQLRIPMSCNRPPDGDYRVEGLLTFGGTSTKLGPFALKVSSDPALVVPQIGVP